MARLKVAVLGTGEVGKTLSQGLLGLGHQVMMGARDTNNPKASAWAKGAGERASHGSFHDAAAWADMVVLATLGTASEEAVRLAGITNLSRKVLMDVTNPLIYEPGKLPTLSIGHNDSLGEHLQRLAPECHVVKAFNTVGHAHMINPKFKEGRPDMFICGNDEAAKRSVTELIAMWGWGVVDLGDITSSRYLEPMCLAWVIYGIKTNTWNHAFKLLRK